MKILKGVALVLISILAISFGTTSVLASSAIVGSTSTNANSANAQIKQMIDQSYIDLFGLKSTLTDIVSTFNFYNSSSKMNYSYNAKFASRNGSYTVGLNYNLITSSNLETSISEENISGTMNFYSLTNINKTTLTNNIVRNESSFIQYNDTSGIHCFSAQETVVSTLNEANILNASVTGYQSISGENQQFSANILQTQVGNQIANIAPTQVAYQINYVPATGQNQTAFISPANASGATSSSSYNSDDSFSPLTVGAALMDTIPERNSWKAGGVYVWWDQSVSMDVGWFMTILGAVVTLTGPWGIAILVTGVLLLEASAFQADMGNGYSLTIVYLLAASYMLFGFVPLPLYFEMGFYTDKVVTPIGTWTGSWSYFDAYDTTQSFFTEYFWIFGGNRTDPFPVDLPTLLDPAIAVYAYDESNDVYVNVPISIDGGPVSTGSVLYGPSGDYTFQAFDSDSGGAFNCFYDGNYYGNPAVVNISSDETITAYYNYIPTYCVTFYAQQFDNYPISTDVYVNGEWVGYTDPNSGSLTVYLPLGVYTIAADQYAWDPIYNCWDTLMGTVGAGLDGYGNLWVTCDTSVGFQYY
jgi:hypothetical protein